MATASQTRTQGMTSGAHDMGTDNNSTRSGGYFAPSAGNGTDHDGYYDASEGRNGPNGHHYDDRNGGSQRYQNGHNDEDSLSKGINSIGLGGANGYDRSASYSSNKRPGMNDQPSRSYIKNQSQNQNQNHDGDNQVGNTTVTTTFVEFDDTTPSVTGGPTGGLGSTPGGAGGLNVPGGQSGHSGQNTPGARSGRSLQSGTGVPSGPAAGGFFPSGTTARDTTPTPQGQGLNNSVNDNYVDRSGNQLHHDDDDVFGVSGTGNSNSNANGGSYGSRDLGPQETLGNVQKRPEHRHANKSHGSQYMIVENFPHRDSRATTPRPDYTASAAHWDPAAGAVVERSTPQHEYPPHIDQRGHNDSLSPQYGQQGQQGMQDRRNSGHSGLRNAGAAALGAGAGAAAGERLGDHHHTQQQQQQQPYSDNRYGDDSYGGGGNDRGVNFHDGPAPGQRLPQTDGRDYSQRQSQQQQQQPQQRFPEAQRYDQGHGEPTVAAVGAPMGQNGQGQQRGQESYNDGGRPRSRQTSFRDDYRDPVRTPSQRDTMPKSHSDRHNLAAAATGAGVGAGVGAGLGSGMRRSASAGSGLIRGNRERRASGGTGSIGHGHGIGRPSTADGYRDRDRFRRGNGAGYDDRLPPVEDYDEDDEVRGLEPGQIVTPSRQRALQASSGGRGGGASDYDGASQQPRSRSAFGHRPQPSNGGYDEFGAEDEGYGQGRAPTRAGTVRSTRSRRPGTAMSMSGAPRRGAFGQGAALSTGTNPHDVLSRQDLHERASLAERALSPGELKRLQGMEKKDAKRLTKLMKDEEKQQARSLHQALADMKRLTRLQKEAISQESKSQRNLAKWTSREHKARLHFLKEKERYEAIEAKLRNAENDFEERRDHAYGLTEQVAERNQEIDDMRALKAADDRERAIKMSTLKHPGHA